MKAIRFLLLLFVTMCSFTLNTKAREDSTTIKKGEHNYTVHISVMNQIFNPSKDLYEYRQPSVEGRLPNFLSARNNINYQLGFEYEYVFKNQVTLSAGLRYGIAKYHYEWNINTDYFFPAGSNVKTFRFKEVYSGTLPYGNIGINAGYRFKPSKKSKLTLHPKAGVNTAYFFNVEGQRYFHSLSYKRNDTIFAHILGSTHHETSRFLVNYNLYLGVVYPMNTKMLKELRVGVEYIQHLALKKDRGTLDLASTVYYDSNGDIVGTDYYFNRFRNIALRVGFTF